MSNANTIERPFRLIQKQDCPDPRLIDAFLFFETGGVVEAVEWEDFNDSWKVYVHSYDGHN